MVYINHFHRCLENGDVLIISCVLHNRELSKLRYIPQLNVNLVENIWCKDYRNKSTAVPFHLKGFTIPTCSSSSLSSPSYVNSPPNGGRDSTGGGRDSGGRRHMLLMK
ncbi:hypothetical protein ABKN59_001582 [Abortiporus biennis]